MGALSNAVDWAPDSALRDRRVTDALSGVFDAWRRDWFMEPGAPPLGGDLSLTTRRVGDGDMCWRGDGLILAVGRRQLVAIGAAMTGFTAPLSRADDDAILASVASPCAEDLWARVSAFLQVPALSHSTAPTSIDSAARFSYRLDASISFDLFASRPRLAAVRKRLSLPRMPSTPLAARTAALALQPVNISVVVGGARLRLAEFAALSIGDVIVLDRAMNDELALDIDGREAGALRCRLQRDGERTQARITTPLAS